MSHFSTTRRGTFVCNLLQTVGARKASSGGGVVVVVDVVAVRTARRRRRRRSYAVRSSCTRVHTRALYYINIIFLLRAGVETSETRRQR